MARSSVATAGVVALVLAFSAGSLAVAQDGVPADPVENPNTGEVSDTLILKPTPMRSTPSTSVCSTTVTGWA